MEQKTIKKFQMIGSCTQMQTFSLEAEIELIDGIQYDINFNQNFSFYCLEGRLLEEVPVQTILKIIVSTENADAMLCVNRSKPSVEDYRRTQELKECLYNDSKERRKLEKKWKKKRSRTVKEAENNFNLALEKIMEVK